MDKASIIKDAINYIQELRAQEKRIETEISDLESGKIKNTITNEDQAMDEDEDEDDDGISREKRTSNNRQIPESPPSFPIEILDLSVNYMGEKTMVVSLACGRRSDTILKVCQVIESLKLKIITANISIVANKLLSTLFLEAEGAEEEEVKVKIETAIAAISDPENPMSI